MSDGGDTIADSASGLVWQRCSKGQTGTDCSGGVASNTDIQSSAVSYCSSLNLAGKTWRLPSIRELLLLPNYNYTNPAVDDNDVSNYFPNHPGNGAAAKFWTTSAYMPAASNFWFVDMRTGDSNYQLESIGSYVKCVSGLSMPAADYEDKVNGTDYTVLDKTTNLLWTKCSLDGSGLIGTPKDAGGGSCTVLFDGSDNKTWINALAQCESLSYAGRSDWRLPNVRELASIVKNDAGSAPYIDQSFFPATTPNYYWSSSTLVNSYFNAKVVSFNFGLIYYLDKAQAHYVRCVTTGP